jgi:hypothetical protein
LAAPGALCANSSQAKGRVERMNGTLQDRLVKELRLRGIDTREAANAYAPAFIADSMRALPRCRAASSMRTGRCTATRTVGNDERPRSDGHEADAWHRAQAADQSARPIWSQPSRAPRPTLSPSIGSRQRHRVTNESLSRKTKANAVGSVRRSPH